MRSIVRRGRSGLRPAPTVAQLNTGVEPGAGALALAGFAPIVAATGHVGVTPGVGALSFAGFAPTVTGTLTFDAMRQDIIDGLVSAQSEASGWNAQRANIPVTALTRTSDTVATLALPALAGYDITAEEVITATIPAAATSVATPIVATPTISIDPDAGDVGVVPGAGTLTLTGFAPSVSPSGGGGPELVFASDWSTATGTGNTAVLDGGKWDTANNVNSPTAGRVTVISASGLDFPSGMANVLAIRYENSTDTFCGISLANGWDLPPIGGSIYFRTYFRHDISGSHSAINHHPVQMCSSAGSCCPQGWWRMAKGATFPMGVSAAESGGGEHLWATTISRETTYRFEEQYERTGTNTYTMHLRIYNSANQLVKQDADFDCHFHGPGQHLLSTEPSITVTDLTCYRNKMIVNQGVGFFGWGSDDPAHNRIFYGGFAVSLTGWCGAWTAGEG